MKKEQFTMRLIEKIFSEVAGGSFNFGKIGG